MLILIVSQQLMWCKIEPFLANTELDFAYRGDNHKWLTICGESEGHSFQFIDPKYCLVSVRGKCGSFIDRLHFLFLDITKKEFVQSAAYGGQGGLEFLFQPPPGQWITKIYAWSLIQLQAIQFQTNKGFKSPKYGGNKGAVEIIDAEGKRICGVKSRSDAYIGSISFAINY